MKAPPPKPDTTALFGLPASAPNSATAANQMLHGRLSERSAIDSLLEQTRTGRGGCVVLDRKSVV